ncbi:MAG: NAAT family transporter [Proteobacteria bacterium]|nr:NAAT family transporter [Pseudomonadota bacterium]
MDTLKAFITLLALINPFGAIPMFLSLTAHQSRPQLHRTINTAAIATAVVIGVSALFGQTLLGIFGISIASLQVGGGVLLFLIALNMFNAEPGRARSTPEEAHEATERASIAVVPLTIPLLAGPGTMSSVIILSENARHWWQLALLVLIGVAIGGVVWITLRLARPISRLAGQTGLNIMTRVMGLVLAALAVEFIANGVRTLVRA